MTIQHLLYMIDGIFDLGVNIGTERQKLLDIVYTKGTTEPSAIAQSNALDNLLVEHARVKYTVYTTVVQFIDDARKADEAFMQELREHAVEMRTSIIPTD